MFELVNCLVFILYPGEIKANLLGYKSEIYPGEIKANLLGYKSEIYPGEIKANLLGYKSEIQNIFVLLKIQ